MFFEGLIRRGDITLFLLGALILWVISPRAHRRILSHFLLMCGKVAV